MLVWFLVLAGSLAVLIYSSDGFVRISASIGKSLRIPQYVVGATLVAIGTSLPELITSVVAAAKETGEFVAGNVVGSNIANIGLILGVSGLAAGLIPASKSLYRRDIPFLVIATLGLVILGWDGVVAGFDGYILLGVFLLYIVLMFTQKDAGVEETPPFHWWYLPLLGVCCFGIYLGSEYTVVAVIKIAEKIEFADTSLIAVTVVALGTSLPELAASMAAVRQKHTDIILGNVIGSNICNCLLVMSVPTFISGLPITEKLLQISVPAMLIATVLMTLFLVTGRTLVRWEATLLLLLYAGSIALLWT